MQAGEAASTQILKEARAREEERLRQVKKELQQKRDHTMAELRPMGQAMAHDLVVRLLDRKVA